MKQFKTITVGRIERTDDRMLIYEAATPTGSPEEYRVIASLTCPARVGDVIEYQHFGRNFGWFYIVVKIKEID